jgi:hypothetical protein
LPWRDGQQLAVYFDTNIAYSAYGFTFLQGIASFEDAAGALGIGSKGNALARYGRNSSKFCHGDVR